MPAAACRASVLAGINAFSGAPDRQGPLQALGAAPGPAAATPRHVISSVPGKMRTPAVRCWNRPL